MLIPHNSRPLQAFWLCTCLIFDSTGAGEHLHNIGRVPAWPVRIGNDVLVAGDAEEDDQELPCESLFGLSMETTIAYDSWVRRDFLVHQVVNSGGFRMPGEFEYQQALMISCQAIQSIVGMRDVFHAVTGRVSVVALHCDDEEYKASCVTLAETGIPLNSLYFAAVPHNSMWTRDYGPVALTSKNNGDIAVLDTRYNEANREDDEVVPLVVAESARLPVVSSALKIEGGNLISNGQGLVITTTKLLDENPGIDEQTVTEALQEYYGATQIVYLEPLTSEPTGHVDMFATFTSADCVVVGQYAVSDDRGNSDILERNARRLAAVRLPQGNLFVCRIPMPTNADGTWRTYTNVVYANGVLLMPIYSGTRLDLQQKAVATYQALLPGWTVALINADDVILSGGALHCVIMNLGPLSVERIGLGPRASTPNRQCVKRVRRDFFR